MSQLGRPSALDDKKRSQIIGVVALGGSIATAARAVGCCPRTIYNTARRDEAFRNELQRARAQRELTLLKSIQSAADLPQYWRAAAWMLERLFPDHYGRNTAKDVPVAAHQASLEFVLNIVHEELREHADLYPRITARLQTALTQHAADIAGVADTALELFMRNEEETANG